MLDYLAYLLTKNRATTARTAGQALDQYAGWLRTQGLHPVTITAAQAESYLRWLTVTYRTPEGNPLAASTRSARISYIKGWYQWMEDRGTIAVDPSRSLRVHYQRPREVVRQHLSLQEITAMMQSLAARVERREEETHRWCLAVRDLAIIGLTVATGRRSSGVCAWTVADVNRAESEIRVDHEKGTKGRVLPLTDWALAALETYLDEARPLLVARSDVPHLFLNREGDGPITRDALKWMLQELLNQTIRENPDLDELAEKTLSWHSLRVSFAKLLFDNGCNIRFVNELLLHRRLSTTARYTPLTTEEMRHQLSHFSKTRQWRTVL